jgi:hypothetical protein
MKLSPFVVPKKQQNDITFDSPIQIIVPRKGAENETSDEDDI